MGIFYLDSASFNDVTITGSLIVSGGNVNATASFATTASYALNATATINTSSFITTGSSGGTQAITGSLTVTQNLTILGSASISYISQSTLNIGTNLITVNTQSPSTRFGGLAVIDSGSSPQRSGSLLFDSTNNQWVFIHQNTGGAITSSVLVQTPQTFNNVGNETMLTTNRIVKAFGGDLGEHIGDSNITDNGSVVSINSNTQITGSAIVSSNLSIGTTLTTSPLTVVTSASPLITIQSTTANSYTNMRYSGSGRSYTVGVGNASETTFGVANEFFIYDDTQGAMRMAIDTTGRVGIGTTAPGSLLHVQGAVSASSYTGSLFGTASWATNAVTASSVTQFRHSFLLMGGR